MQGRFSVLISICIFTHNYPYSHSESAYLLWCRDQSIGDFWGVFLLSDFKHPTEVPELIASFLTQQWRTFGTSRYDLAQESLFLGACALQRKSEHVDHQTAFETWI